MRKPTLVMILVISVLLLTSCDDYKKYYGEYFPLVVVARSSLLGVTGSLSDEVLVIETDSYGRTLFAYRGYSIVSQSDIIAIVVSQKTTLNATYFYDGVNFLVSENLNDPKQELTLNYVNEMFLQTEIDQLKINNDWNVTLDNDKLFKQEIERNKSQTVTRSKQKAVFSKLSDLFDESSSIILSHDKQGLSLYLMVGREYDDSTKIFYYGP
jgi:hypothetical protein